MSEPDTDAVPLLYANWVRVVGTPFDLGIDVGYRVGDQPPPPQARVVMAWEHAVVLRDLLDRTIETYERNVGALRALSTGIIELGDENADGETKAQGGEVADGGDAQKA